MSEDPHGPCKADIGRDGWRVTPWMLGVYVGRQGALLGPPESYIPADVRAYWSGVQEGMSHPQRALK